jgi:FkbM family methyltransferase
VEPERITLTTPKGNHFDVLCRPDTDDGSLASGIMWSDEYRLKDMDRLEGTGLDVGAHIGTVSFALLADHPGLKMVAVEPIPENADLIRRAAGQFPGRLTVLEAAAGLKSETTIDYDFVWAEGETTEYVHNTRYIGGMWRPDKPHTGRSVTVPSMKLAGFAAVAGVPGFAFVKTDCEGGEYALFADGALQADFIIGEWHDGDEKRIYALLAPTHYFMVLSDQGGTGIFAAAPKPGVQA